MVGFPDLHISGKLTNFWCNDLAKEPYYEIKYIRTIHTGLSVIKTENVMRCPVVSTVVIEIKNRTTERL
jgi:hypothetical protein